MTWWVQFIEEKVDVLKIVRLAQNSDSNETHWIEVNFSESSVASTTIIKTDVRQ